MTLARNATGIEARIRDDALGHSERSLVLAVAHGAVVAQADNATETCFGRGVQIFDRYGSPVLAVFDHAVRYAGDHTEPAFGSYAAREGHRAILVDDDVLNRGAGTYMSEERRIAFPRLDKPAVTAEHTIERTCGGADRRPGLDFAHIDVREHVHEHAAFVFSGPVGDIFAGVPCLGEHLESGSRNDAACGHEVLRDGWQRDGPAAVLDRELDNAFASGLRVTEVFAYPEFENRVEAILCRRFGTLNPVGNLDLLDDTERSRDLERDIALGCHGDLAVVSHVHFAAKLENSELAVIVFRRNQLHGSVTRLLAGIGVDADVHDGHSLAELVDCRGTDLLGLDPVGGFDRPLRSGTHLDVV